MKHQIIPNSLKDSFEPIIRLNIKNISSFHFDTETWTFSLEIVTGSNISVKRAEFFRRFSSFPGGPVITKDFLLDADGLLTSHFKHLMDAKYSLKLILNPLSREAFCQWPTNVLYSFRISLIDFLFINTEKKSQRNTPLKSKTLTFPVLLPDWAVILPEEFLQKVQQRHQYMNAVALQGNLWPFCETEFHIFKPNSSKYTSTLNFTSG